MREYTSAEVEWALHEALQAPGKRYFYGTKLERGLRIMLELENAKLREQVADLLADKETVMAQGRHSMAHRTLASHYMDGIL